MMVEPKNVLLVTNATTESEILLIKEAIAHAREQNLAIRLSLVHVNPNLPACYFNIPSMVLLAEGYYAEATRVLTNIGSALNVAKRDQWIVTGRIKTEVLRLADRLETDFILASSTSIQDLHKSFLFVKKQQNAMPIRNINSLITI